MSFAFRRVAGLAVFVAAMAVGSAAAVAAEVYERGNSADPATLDPQRAASAAEANILRDLYEGLVAYGPAGAIVPGVAADWTVSPDGLTVTFALRPSNWSNGDPVTAADFARALRRLVDPAIAAPDAHLFRGLRNAAGILGGTLPVGALGVRAVDPATLEITLDTPVPYLPQLLARVSASPVHPRAGAGLGAVAPATLVNGPYRIAEYAAGDGLRLEANPAFREAAAVAIPEVVYRPLSPPDAIAAFLSGTLHSNNDVPVLAIGDLHERLGDQLHTTPFLGTLFLAFNTAAEPFSDPRIRRALALAVDRAHLNDDVWAGVMTPALSLVPGGIASYGTPAAIEGPEEIDDRRAAARGLLAEAGFTAERPLSIAIAVPGRDIDRLSAAAIAEDWATIGVATSIAEAPATEHYPRLASGDFAVAMVGWLGDFDDALTFLDLLRGDNERDNVAGYGNAAFDALLAEAAATWDSEVRSALLYKAETLALRDAALVPLLNYTALNLVSQRLGGWQDNVLDIHPTRWLSFTAEAP